MWKKASNTVLTLMLLFHAFFGLGGAVFAADQGSSEITENILTDLKVTMTDSQNSVSVSVYEDSNDVDLDIRWEQGATVKLEYDWALPNDREYGNGSTFTFQLPEAFYLALDQKFNLQYEGNIIGRFYADRMTNQAVMTFTNIESYDEVRGSLWFETTFNKQKLSDETTQTIKFDVKGQEYLTLTLHFKPENGTQIDKQGQAIDNEGNPQTFNAKRIAWTVDVNTVLDSVYGVQVTDTLPSGVQLDADTVKVYNLDVKLNGSTTVGSEVSLAPSAVNISGNQFTVQLGDISSAYRIEYVTDITDDSGDPELTFENEAVFSGTNQPSVSDTATVTVKQGQWLDKTSSAYDVSTQTITWQIRYNYNGQTISPSDVLMDWFDDTQELVLGSVKVYPMTIDPNGGETKGSPLSASSEYELELTSDPTIAKNGFKFNFTNTVTSPFLIEYQTRAADVVTAPVTIYNEVTAGSKSVSTGRYIWPHVLEKTGDNNSTNYSNRQIEWTIKLFGGINKFDSGVVLNDYLGDNLLFLPETLVVESASGAPSVYEVVYTDLNYGSDFSIHFAGSIHETVTIKYKTSYKDLGSGIAEFRNDASLDWIGVNVQEDYKSVTRSFAPNDAAKGNGFKKGAYDATSKTIKWELGLNYNSQEITAPVVVDPLQAGQKYEDGSVRVYEMNIAEDGSYSYDEEHPIDANLYNVDLDPETNTLTVSFKQVIDSPYVMTFETTYDGSLIDQNQVSNSAVLKDNDTPVTKPLLATVSIKHGGEYILKEGTQDGAHINWTVYINRAQSYVNHATIMDTPSSNQLLIQDSFKLYDTDVAVNGTVTKGEELVEGVDGDYRLSIQTDSVNGTQSFELKFNNPIDSPYILEYRSLIDAEDGESVTNEVSFAGENIDTVTKETETEVTVEFSQGGGTGSGINRTLTVLKVDQDEPSQVLEGAEFTLERKKGSDWVHRETKVTDEYGVITFEKLISGEYRLTEVQAPHGYELSTVPTPITVLTTDSNKEVTITNVKTLDPTDPADPPTDPADPPTDPADPPTDPADPPTDPADPPTAPEVPTYPVYPPPVVPADPSDPLDPTEPEQPSEPVDPTEPEDPPTDPADPTEPEEPINPPTEPVEDEGTENDAAETQTTPVTTSKETALEGQVKVPQGSTPSICQNPEHGSVTVHSDGRWVYTPEEGYTGTDHFCIQVVDAKGNQVMHAFDVNVVDAQKESAGQGGEMLPKTGEGNYLPLQLTGLLMILFAIAFALRKKGVSK
ncbi:collagen binding domain-containing protein [Marinicrinis lubricantis]|uniref:Collagen binding domain-containing protein n=1 Tax=Marinicrinis lubricantis TaxID=2086470 RepID=A0ABW1IUE4_9BACL